MSYSTALLPFVTTVVLGMFCDAIGHWSDAVACENSKGTRGFSGYVAFSCVM